jgi:hypothetical protein
VTLTGKDAADLMAQLRERNAKQRNDELATAKADAEAKGKERFDLAKLESLVDTSSEGRVDPIEERRARFEEMYYTEYPEVLTLVAFAEKVRERNKW